MAFMGDIRIMNPVKQKHYVSHPKFSPEQLNEKGIAVPSGDSFRYDYTLKIGSPIRKDGKYVLLVAHLRLTAPTTRKNGLIEFPGKALDQATVDRIEAAPPDSFEKRKGCDFVILPKGR